jgi:hypothetical protein
VKKIINKMEDLPDNIYETKLQLHKTEERDSEKCDKFYLVSFINEEKIILK